LSKLDYLTDRFNIYRQFIWKVVNTTT